MQNQLETIIEANVALLRQGARIVSEIDHRLFTKVVPGIPSLRIGAHIRHVLDFYECFLAGVALGLVDYEARPRNRNIERNREDALRAIDAVASRLLARRSSIAADEPVWVRPEDAPDSGEPMLSTVARELQVLASHTVHHYALIAVTLQALGQPVDASFGVAPSTLRYREAAAAGVHV